MQALLTRPVSDATFAVALATRPVNAASYAWEAYPVEGACAVPVSLQGHLGDAVFGVPVGTPSGMPSTPAALPAVVGAPSALPIVTGIFAVPAALNALLATPHAIAVVGVEHTGPEVGESDEAAQQAAGSRQQAAGAQCR